MWQPKPPMWAPGIRQGHPLAQGLEMYLPMWEGSGTLAMDVSGNGLHGTLTNHEAADWKPGLAGGYIENGASEYVLIAPSPRLAVVQYTVYMIVRGAAAGHSSFAALWSKGTTSVAELTFSRYTSDVWVVYHRTTASILTTTMSDIFTGQFVAVAITWAGAGAGNGKLWKNGVLIEAFQNDTLPTSSTTTPFRFGASRYETSLVCDQLVAGMWNRILTASEIAELYADPWSLITPRQRSYFYAATAPGSLASPWYYHLQQAVAA